MKLFLFSDLGAENDTRPLGRGKEKERECGLGTGEEG